LNRLKTARDHSPKSAWQLAVALSLVPEDFRPPSAFDSGQGDGIAQHF